MVTFDRDEKTIEPKENYSKSHNDSTKHQNKVCTHNHTLMHAQCELPFILKSPALHPPQMSRGWNWGSADCAQVVVVVVTAVVVVGGGGDE